MFQSIHGHAQQAQRGENHVIGATSTFASIQGQAKKAENHINNDYIFVSQANQRENHINDNTICLSKYPCTIRTKGESSKLQKHLCFKVFMNE